MVDRVPQIAASLMCADPLNLRRDILELEPEIDLWHVDVMDGSYVPNFALNRDTVRAVRAISKKPIDVHLMVENPEDHIYGFADAGANYISFHSDASRFERRTLQLIRDLGIKAGLAVNPAETLDAVEYSIDLCDFVLVMTVEPGFAGQAFIERAATKIPEVRRVAEGAGAKVEIEVDGNISVENGARCARDGATLLVLGTSGIFKGNGSLRENAREFKGKIGAMICGDI